MPLIRKSYRKAVPVKTPQLFYQAVLKFAGPFSSEKGSYRLPAYGEFRAVSPDRVFRVAQHDTVGIAAIPEIFRHLYLKESAVFGERGS